MTTTPTPLAEATRRRSKDTRARARAALRKLDHDRETVNFATVARAAGVSRSLLYRDPTLRQQIETIRSPQATATPRPPAAQRMSPASREQRLTTLQDENRALRHENDNLRERLAAVLGDERTSRTTTRGRHVADTKPQQ